MKPRQEIPPLLQSLADLQSGVLSREQVRAHGVSDRVIERLITSGWWKPLARGLYGTSPGPPDWMGMAWGGILLGGEGARLGARASAHLHRVCDEVPDPIDVLVPTGRSARIGGAWEFSRERAGVRSARAVGSPPRLPVADAVLDLAAQLDEPDVVGLVTRAVQRRRVSAPRLAEALSQRRRHPHRVLLRHLLWDVADGAESPLELTFLRRVERPHGLPDGRRQRSRRGLRYATDVGYDGYDLLVELDGRAGHEGEGEFRDMRRDNKFVLVSLASLRYGWFDVTGRPCEVAFEVACALAQRGWPGPFTRCPSCMAVPDSDLYA